MSQPIGRPPGWGHRHLLLLDGHAVHVQRAGEPGKPCVILLHGSPDSSDALRPLALHLAQGFDVIAPDTPGNGFSTPLPNPDPDADAYAAALIALMDALGVRRAGLYGFHTGAGTAMAAGLLAPERFTTLVLDGYPVWTEAERTEMLARYLVRFPIVANGAHLTAIWQRLEAQTRFFPWYDTRPQARFDAPPPPLGVRLRRLRDWLLAGDHYRAPYRAAFVRHGELGPDRTPVPTLIGAVAADPLSRHLDRLVDTSSAVTTEVWASRDDAMEQIAAQFLAHPASAAPPVAPGDLPAMLTTPPAPVPAWQADAEGRFLLPLWAQLSGSAEARQSQLIHLLIHHQQTGG